MKGVTIDIKSAAFPDQFVSDAKKASEGVWNAGGKSNTV